MSKISIIVPTYNQAPYLPTCLDSAWFQDHPDIEIVVVNDGSTDDTAQVLEQYLKALPEERTSFASNYDAAHNVVERTWHLRYPQEGRAIVVLQNEKNLGLSETLNRGFKAARGEYCTFIASDDMLHPSMASELLRALQLHQADFAYADMHIVDDQGRILRRFALPDYSFEKAFCHWYLCGICKLYKRELHEKFGYYDPEYVAQDHEMFLRFAMGGARFAHLGKVLASVRIHEKDRKVDNHSPESESRQFQDSMRLVLQAREFLARSGKGEG